MNSQLGNGKKLLASLKFSAGSPGSCLIIPVGSPVRALLRPIATNVLQLALEDAICLSEWRNRFVTHFLTEFYATPDRTTAWLTRVVGPNENKMLFMLDLLNGATIGHIGLDCIDWETGYGEADSIVRGRDAPKGVMRDALTTAISWAQGQLGLSTIGVRVRSDNSALEFYKKIGFVEIKRVPLLRIDEPDMTRWVEDAGLREADVFLIHMNYKSNL